MSEVALDRTVNPGDSTVLALGRGQLGPLRISGHHGKAMTNKSGYIAPSVNPSFGQRTPRIPRDTQVPGSRVPDPATNRSLPDLDQTDAQNRARAAPPADDRRGVACSIRPSARYSASWMAFRRVRASLACGVTLAIRDEGRLRLCVAALVVVTEGFLQRC